MNVIEVEGLSKDYRQHFWTPLRRVLDSVSFEVREAEIFGFLGPNGSGKSTTIKILLEIIFATSGRAKIFGEPVGSRLAKRSIGFLPENPYFYDYLTARDFLIFHGRLQNLSTLEVEKRIPEVMDLTGMKGTEDIPLRQFSKGMLQRIGLAQAILHDPKLVILDEPMTGLDPVGRKEVRDLMLRLKDQGKTVFFSTHILSDVEMVCDRLAILNKGKLLKSGRLEEMISVDIKYMDIVWSRHNTEVYRLLHDEDPKITRSGESLYLKLHPRLGEASKDFEVRANELIAKTLKMGAVLHSVSPKKETLEDFFVHHVGVLESRV